MERKSRIRPSQVRQKSAIIKPTEVNASVSISFNFKNLVQKSTKFEYKHQPNKYFVKFIERLSSISTMSKKEIITSHSDALRCHRIIFSESRVSESGFGLKAEIDDDAWQFQISTCAHGRIHGYFIGNIFYVVWLDPKHSLYPGKGKA